MQAGTWEPRTTAGQEQAEYVGQKLAEHGPAMIGIGPELGALGQVVGQAARGTRAIGVGGVVGRQVASAAELGGKVVPEAVVDLAARAVTPTMTPERLALAQKATEAGIPLNVHQLSSNRLVRMAGEASEGVPLAGSGKAARQEAFSNGLVKSLDPTSTETKLTPEVFDQLQTKSGKEIGDISARTPVPLTSLADVADVARRETPDVKATIQTYADDLKTVAGDNGGIIPGTTLRKLRTEAQTQARTTPNGDLRRTLGDFVNRIDTALTEHAAEGDMDALMDARRRYAIGTVLEPLVAKTTTGDISPAALMNRITATAEGKRRMARNRGGELGDYAKIGQEFLKEQGTSGTAERNALFRIVTDAAIAGKTAAMYLPAAAYNRLGPRAAKWMLDRAAKRNAPPPELPPPEPLTGQGLWGAESSAAPTPAQIQAKALADRLAAKGGPNSPLGDLTPEPGTELGAGGAPMELRQGQTATPPGASVSKLGVAPPELGEPELRLAPGGVPPVVKRAGEQVPPVPGRPGLPETMVAGAPAEVSPNAATNAAMVTPEAALARQQQGAAAAEAAAAQERAQPVPAGQATEIRPQVVEPAGAPPEPPPEPIPAGVAKELPIGAMDARLLEIEKLKAEATSDTVRKTLDERAKTIVKEIESKKAAAQKLVDAADLRKTAESITDPDTKKALLDKADKLDPPPKTEGESNAAAKVTQQAGVQQERGSGNEGGTPAEAGAGNSVQREAQGQPTTEGKVNEDNQGANVPSGESPDLTANDNGPNGPAAAAAGNDQGSAAGQGSEAGAKQAEVAPKTAAELAQDLADLRDRKPRSIQQTFGRNGPTPEQAAAHQEKLNAWASEYRKVRIQQKAALDRENAAFEAGKTDEHQNLDLPKIDEGFMDEQQKQQADAAPPVSDRGVEAVRTALQKGADNGTLDKDGVSLALWALDRNPNLAKGFEGKEGLSVTTQPKASAMKGERGAYSSSLQLIRLVEGFDGSDSALHEILHHTERMMPTEMRDGIRREWRAAVDDAIEKNKDTNPEVAAALQKARDAVAEGFTPEARAEVLNKFQDGTLNSADHYQLVNPSEYWAKNATRILQEKFNGRGSWRAEAVRWLKDLMEHIKGTIGLRSDAPVLKAIDAILNPETTTGEQTAPTMLTKAGLPPGK